MTRTPAFLATAAMICLAKGASAASISGTYYEDRTVVSGAGSSCHNQYYCILTFPLDPATTGKFVTVTEIGCSGSVSQPLGAADVFIADNGANARRFRNLNLNFVRTPAGKFSFLSPFQYKVAGGPPRVLYLQLVADSAAQWILSCSLVGEITNN